MTFISWWSRLRHTLFSAEAHELRRQRLVRDMTRSNANDIGKLVKTPGGKFFPAIHLSDSCHLPSLVVQAINGITFNLAEQCRDRVSLVTISGSAFAEPQLESFRKPFLEAYSPIQKSSTSPSPVQLIDVRPIMSRTKWWLFSTLLKSAAIKTIPTHLHATFLVLYRPMSLLEALEVPNYLGSFIYLIDRKGQVRWKASGEATDEELHTMHRLIKQLLKEH